MEGMQVERAKSQSGPCQIPRVKGWPEEHKSKKDEEEEEEKREEGEEESII